MNRFATLQTPLDGLLVLERQPIGDRRGYLERMYCAEELRGLLGGKSVAQINRTLTARRGTVRGMHFQRPPHAETKLVTCLKGDVFDVAVDVRRGSPTFLRWHGEILSGEGFKTLWIPEGFAHGFQTLSDDVQMLYLHTAPHVPASEGSLHAQDPALKIDWPLPVVEMSDRDRAHPLLTDGFEGVRP